MTDTTALRKVAKAAEELANALTRALTTDKHEYSDTTIFRYDFVDELDRLRVALRDAAAKEEPCTRS